MYDKGIFYLRQIFVGSNLYNPLSEDLASGTTALLVFIELNGFEVLQGLLNPRSPRPRSLLRSSRKRILELEILVEALDRAEHLRLSRRLRQRRIKVPVS